MKKNLNLVIYIIVINIVILLSFLLYTMFKDDNSKSIVFNIKYNSTEIKIGSEKLIEYDINKNVNIKWESMNNKVVTINSNGMIKGIGLGSTTIKGIVEEDNNTIIRTCYVTTYYGDSNSKLKDINIPEGELFITKGEYYQIPISYDPENAHITSIEYNSYDTNIAEFDGVVYAKNTGTTYITITINKNISKTITINVIDKKIEPIFSQKVQTVSINEESLILKPKETRKIDYSIEPTNAFIESIKWTSSDPEIVSVDEDGYLIANTKGNATIKLLINDNIVKEIDVSVNVATTGIVLNSRPKIVLKAGKQEKILVDVLPSDASNKDVKYTSSNPSSLKINSDGTATAIAAGSGNIKAITVDGEHQVSIPFIINPKNGVVNGDGGVWGYKVDPIRVPVRADLAFFKKLASNGKGVVSDNTYVFNKGNKRYSYDILHNILSVDKRNIYVRFYYPKNVDLSNLNTFTFFGGYGELNFQSYFSAIEKNTSIIKSSGIIILVSGRGGYDASDGLYSTEFFKSIINQKNGVKNAVGGYSMSGPAAADAANQGSYDRLIIFDSYFTNASRKNNLKNKEIIIYSPSGDDLAKKTQETLNNMMSSNYNDVTIVSNNQYYANNYSSRFLVINPGSKMGRGHTYVNITNANVFAYACS